MRKIWHTWHLAFNERWIKPWVRSYNTDFSIDNLLENDYRKMHAKSKCNKDKKERENKRKANLKHKIL